MKHPNYIVIEHTDDTLGFWADWVAAGGSMEVISL